MFKYLFETVYLNCSTNSILYLFHYKNVYNYGLSYKKTDKRQLKQFFELPLTSDSVYVNGQTCLVNLQTQIQTFEFILKNVEHNLCILLFRFLTNDKIHKNQNCNSRITDIAIYFSGNKITETFSSKHLFTVKINKQGK